MAFVASGFGGFGLLWLLWLFSSTTMEDISIVMPLLSKSLLFISCYDLSILSIIFKSQLVF